MEKREITLPDGRKVELLIAGEKSTDAIVFHHGTPGSAQTWKEWLPAVAQAGAYAFSFSRPGYGRSARHKGRLVIDNSADVAFILGQLGIERIVSIGWSGGGPHALADTTLAQSLAAISIAGVGAYGASDLDFLEGMGEENHIEFGAAILGEAAIDKWMQENSGGTANVTGDQLIEALGGLIGDADKRSLTPQVAESVAADFRDALSLGYFGWLDDDLAFVEHWGFDITAIKQPVELWQGDEDFMVPHAHGKWLASKIPNSQLIFEPGEGHISLGENKKSAIISSALRYFN